MAGSDGIKAPKSRREYRRNYYLANRVKSSDQSKAWRRNNPDKVRANNKRNYECARVTLNQRKRRGLPEPTRPCPATCECCGNRPGKIALNLDHCHDTGAFRGWLCVKCNLGIGSLGDTIAGLEAGIAYLRQFDLADRANDLVAQCRGLQEFERRRAAPQ